MPSKSMVFYTIVFGVMAACALLLKDSGYIE